MQSDAYAGVVSTFVVAEVTNNLTMAGDPACLRIDANTPEGKATGLVRDSIVSCLVLVTVYADAVAQVLVHHPQERSCRGAWETRRYDAIRRRALNEMLAEISALQYVVGSMAEPITPIC